MVQQDIDETDTYTKDADQGGRNDVANPYSRWREQEGGREPSTANPDTLEDTDSNKLWGSGTRPELAELIIERFADEKGYFPALSRKQNDVLRLTLLGCSVTEVGKHLKIDKRRVSAHLSRIQKRFKRLLQAVDF